MAKPTLKGAGGSWIILKTLDMPKGTQLWHKLWQGLMELAFKARTAEDLAALTLSRPDGIMVRQAGTHAVLGIEVPYVDHQGDFETQREAVDQGLEAAHKLLHYGRIFEK